MQGLKDSSVRPATTASNRNLTSLRRSSVRWAGSSNATPRTEALQERLEELLVFELKKDGGRNYLRLSVRGLYRHVISAITNRAASKVDHEGLRQMSNTSSSNASPPTMGETISTPLPLGNVLIQESQGPGTNGATTGDDAARPSSSAPQEPITNEGPTTSEDAPPRVSFSRLRRGGSVRHRSVSLGGIPEDSVAARETGVTYRERLGGYLHPRDMRRLVTPFSRSNEPELIVRRHVMLLNFDPLRAIVLRDRLLVLVPDGADSLLVTLEQRVRGGSVQIEESIFGDSEEKDIGETGHSRGTSISGLSGKEKVKKKKNRFLSSILKNSSSALSSMSRQNDDKAEETEKQWSRSQTQSELTEDADSEVSPPDDDDEASDINEWDEMEGREWIDLPFELQCADACLHCVVGLLAEETHELQETTAGYIQRILKLQNGLGEDPLTIIRAVKDAVREMTSRVKGFVQSLNRILDEDEDMALMNLSRLLTNPELFIQPVPPEVLEEESDEPELILEAHLQDALSLMNALDLIKGQIDTASELVDQKLDSARNKLLFANMLISILSLAVASASLIGSFFGMNVPLPNDLENEPNAFTRIVGGTVAGSFVFCILILVGLFYSGTIPWAQIVGGEAEL